MLIFKANVVDGRSFAPAESARTTRAANFAMCCAIKEESARCVVALQSYNAPEEMRDINVIINKAAGCRAKFMPGRACGERRRRWQQEAGDGVWGVQFSVCARVSTRSGNLIDI
jgi:hypothetical protein